MNTRLFCIVTFLFLTAITLAEAQQTPKIPHVGILFVGGRDQPHHEPGKRAGAWLKYRINRGQEFVIGGYTPDHPFDALIVGYYKDSDLYYVGKVRNGFVPQVRREVYRKFKRLEIDACPFANLPEKKRTMWALTKEEMKNCRWLRPELVAQIEFAEWTPDGHLRHSKFIGLREDKDPWAVRREWPAGKV